MNHRILSKVLKLMFILIAVICIPAIGRAEEPTETPEETAVPTAIPTEMPMIPQYVYEKNEETKTCTLLRLECGTEVDSITIPVGRGWCRPGQYDQ